MASGGVEGADDALRRISRDLRLKQKVFYQILQSSKLGSRAPRVRQLITRLNFNGFAEAQALGGVAAMPAPAGGAAADA